MQAPAETNRPPIVARPRRAPDVFLIGVPRAATTSLYEALGRHPQIYASTLKEACFTCPDVDPHTRHRLETRFFSNGDEYLALFAAARDDQLIVEGCTYNIYSPAAPGLIRALNANARFLVQLRDPLEQMYSNHGIKVVMGDLGADFEQDVERQAQARVGTDERPVNMGSYDLRDKATVAHGLARFIEAFDRGRVHVTLYEDYATQPAAVIRGVLRFLGIDAEVDLRADVLVPHRVARWDRLNRQMASQRVIGRAKNLTPAALHPIARGIAGAIFRRNRRRARRPPMSPALRDKLRDEFRPEVERLSELIGRDLVAIWWSRSAADE
ncbi:MAG: sulfotransferase [Chloroflexota bacterium]